ncbi:hypothetical protein PPL_09176 [Heterostelium album PN500]|uniref:Uncharacterized protein n=1 Tax=Heterostelium pallidum (strain ATCC 26659 / Pp 5 / PN500) TaxID=670386 RepID=D3BKU4_HETP5|nr:hypothetical protein PPL_09176 [Heterostelium album PN500]EFA78524.1 hypothetical protein PPL_09176 [Heterostelium album PN500]|eukprot:XP_020430648.1 hypothetical protein PPL_09176 [Heterostelium album PN500]
MASELTGDQIQKVIGRICYVYLELNRHDLATVWFSRMIYEFKQEPNLWILSMFENHYSVRVLQTNNFINQDYYFFWRSFRNCYGKQHRNISYFYDSLLVDVNEQNLRVSSQLRQKKLENLQQQLQELEVSTKSMPTRKNRQSLMKVRQLRRVIETLKVSISTDSQHHVATASTSSSTSLPEESTAPEDNDDPSLEEENENDDNDHDDDNEDDDVEVDSEDLQVIDPKNKYIRLRNIRDIATYFENPESLLPDTPLIHYINSLNKTKLMAPHFIPPYIRVLVSNPYYFSSLIKSKLDLAISFILKNADVTHYYATSMYVHELIIQGLINMRRFDLAERLLVHCFTCNLMYQPPQNRFQAKIGVRLIDELILQIVMNDNDPFNTTLIKLILNVHPEYIPDYFEAFAQLSLNKADLDIDKLYDQTFNIRPPRLQTVIRTMIFIKKNQSNWFKMPKIEDVLSYIATHNPVISRMNNQDLQLVYHDIFMTLQYMGAKELNIYIDKYIEQLKQNEKQALETFDGTTSLLIKLRPERALEIFELTKPSWLVDDAATIIANVAQKSENLSPETAQKISSFASSENTSTRELSSASILYINSLLNTKFSANTQTDLETTNSSADMTETL